MRKKGSGKIQRSLHVLSLAAAVLSVLGAALSALGGLFVVRLFRYIDTAQRTLPTLEKAARVYLEKNQGATESAASDVLQTSKGKEPKEKKT